MKKCSRCQQNKNEEEFYNYGNGKGHYCKVCTAHITKIQTLRFKLECITYKGGKCIKCGYDKLCLAAYDFHHRDPGHKDFNLSQTHARFSEDIKRELDKCDLLCANCHREEHYGIIDPNTIPKRTVKRTAKLCACGKQIWRTSKLCAKCSGEQATTKIKWPSKEELQVLVWQMPVDRLGKQLGVSGTAISRRCKRLGISKPGAGYWRKKKHTIHRSVV